MIALFVKYGVGEWINVNYIYSGNVRFEISYLKVTFSLTGIVYRTHETLFRCEMILSCAHAAQAPTSTNSSRSRQECRRPFPPAPLSVLMFVYHANKPCFGHLSEPKQG